MKVICAPDKFKGSLRAGDAANAMRRGVERACPDAVVDVCPIADGGEGFIQTLYEAAGGRFHHTHVHSPLADERPIHAPWLSMGVAGDQPPTAAVEMAVASGLQLLAPHQRDPTRTTTRGTGELIFDAWRGHHRILVGIGGSATCDGGCGAAQAMGTRFYDRHGVEITDAITGGTLQSIHRIDPRVSHEGLERTTIIVACDVTNPLTGPQGAAHIYAPQKGATPDQVAQLDDGLRHLARLVREQLGLDYENVPGAGAAGGMGFGLMAFLHAKLVPGIDLVLDAVRFDKRLRDCDLCLTGEGRLDGQSLSGKACIGVAKAAAKRGVPTVALVGSLGVDADRAIAAGLSSYHVIGAGLPADESMRRARQLLEEAAERVVRERMRTP